MKIGFLGLLTLVFITLKLTAVINWSWWYVLAPLWAPLAICGVIIGGMVLIGLLVGSITKSGK